MHDLILRANIGHEEPHEPFEVFPLDGERDALVALKILLHPAVDEGVGSVIDDHRFSCSRL